MLSDVGFCCQIFSFSTQCLLFAPLCGCRKCVGGCISLRGGKGDGLGKLGPNVRGEGGHVNVWVCVCVCFAGQRGHRSGGGGEGCCGIIHRASALKEKLWTATHRKLMLREHTHAYTQIVSDNPGRSNRDPGICCRLCSCEKLSSGKAFSGSPPMRTDSSERHGRT